MLWERLEILLTPQKLVHQRGSMLGKRRGDSQPAQAEAIAEAEAGGDWRTATAALARFLARESRRGVRVKLALSDLWFRFHLMPGMSPRLSEDEILLLARTQFARQYPEAGLEHWDFRFVLQGANLLVVAVEAELLSAIKELSAGAGVRLSGIEPLFSWTFDRFEKALGGFTGWMLLDEPGMLSLAFIEKGQLASMHAQRCEIGQDEAALRLLERQSALLRKDAVEAVIYSVGAERISLPAPWRTRLQQRVLEFDGNP